MEKSPDSTAKQLPRRFNSFVRSIAWLMPIVPHAVAGKNTSGSKDSARIAVTPQITPATMLVSQFAFRNLEAGMGHL